MSIPYSYNNYMLCIDYPDMTWFLSKLSYYLNVEHLDFDIS
jgi:hypothetical protein